MTSRLVHLTLEPNVEDWISGVAIPQQYDFRITAFLSANPQAFMNFNLKLPTHTYSCPRTMEFTNRLLNLFKESDPALERLDSKLPLLSGTLDAGVAAQFVQFCKVINDLPKFEEIVKSPLKAKLPKDLASQWAVVSMCLNKVCKDSIEQVGQYIRRIQDNAMQTLFVRGALKLDNKLITAKTVQDFISELALDLGALNDEL